MNYQEYLKTIIKSSGWSQEQLASQLGVTFVTLNSWINGRSKPRAKALINIEKLYFATVGVESVDATTLTKIRAQALKSKMTPMELAGNKKLLDKLTLYLTYHTNTIEGSTMTLSDVEDVLFDHKVLSNRTAIEQAEARNHQATLHWLIDLLNEDKELKISEELILGTHLRLMNGIMSDAGKYRNHAVRIMGSRVVLANYLKVPELIAELRTNDSQKYDLISRLARMHAQFEQIHPFSDGNGRTGRLIMLVQALAEGKVLPLVRKERKFAYYKALETAQTQGVYEPLELFLAEAMQFSEELLSV
jgi:Fic family protein/DNA-binding XRE family transcriptional regulator